MKKIAAFCLVLLVFVLSVCPALAAPEYQGEVKPNAVMLLDAKSGAVLFEQKADEVIRPASTTKIMTCIIALENSSLDEEVTIGPEGDWTGSGYSLLGTKNGEKIIMKDLLTGLMLLSGNDAAEAIAVHISGSVEAFASLMNSKARELGMNDSHFVNPHGLDKDGHEVTARDMARLTLYAMKNENFMEIVGTASYVMPKTNKNRERTIENTNLLLLQDEEKDYYYEYATGIKTGSTPKAMRCLVASAKKGDTELICLIYGDSTSSGTQRWPLAKGLFEFGFENYETINIQTIIDTLPVVTVQVSNSADENNVLELNAVSIGEKFATLEKALAQDIINNGAYDTTTEFYSSDISAPISTGDSVGIITIRSIATKEVIGKAELEAGRDIAALDTPDEPVKTIQPTVPADTTQQPLQTQGPVKDKEGFVIGIGWLWLALGVILLGLIVFLAISLIKSRR